MSETPYAKLTDSAFEILKNNGGLWSLDSLTSSVMNRTGWQNKLACKNIIRLMRHLGHLDARSTGRDLRDIRLSDRIPPVAEEKLREMRDLLKEARKERDDAVAEKAKALEESKTAAPRSLLVHITDPDGSERKVTGVFHEKLPKLIQLAQARMNIFIYGPTGCGKSHVLAQLAEVMGLDFSFISCTTGMSEGQVGGRLLPVGKGGTFEYVPAEFIERYEKGGIFLFDEIDAADPNVLLIVNAALANGKMAVPNRPSKPYAKKHKDFICGAAANTVGTGADRQYKGRTGLDGATLDRFQIGKVIMDYDPAVEAALCPDDDLRGRLTRYRKAVREHRLERAISTRFMKDAYKMKHPREFGLDFDGWTDSDIDDALFSGWRPDEVTKVRNYRG